MATREDVMKELARRELQRRENYNSGERNTIGNIFERPASAIRAGIRGGISPEKSFIEEYKKGAVNPTGVETFQDEFIRKSQEVGGASESVLVNFIKGLPGSVAGFAADTLTNPAEGLTALATMGISKALAPTKVGKAIKTFMTKERQIGDIVKPVIDRMPKIMNDKWFTTVAKKGQGVVKQIDDALGSAYDEMYKSVGNVKLDPKQIDDILLRSVESQGGGLDMNNPLLRDIDSIFGGQKIDSVDKARVLVKLLDKRTPSSYFKLQGTAGKGGMANAKVVQMSTRRAIREAMDDAIMKANPELGKDFKALNQFASKEVYPKLEKMVSIFGKNQSPKTEELVSTFQLRSFGKAAQRETIRSLPKMSKGFRSYVAKEYLNDLKGLEKSAKRLVGDMGSYRMRQGLKGIGIAGVTTVGGYYGYKALRDFAP